MAELTAAGQLFTQDVYESYIGEVKKERQLLRHFACTLHMIVILPASIVLLRKVSITDVVHL